MQRISKISTNKGNCYSNTISQKIQWNLVIKEVGYNKTLLYQGNFANLSSLYFLGFLPWYNEKPDITK